jgi:hypothetical protein
MIVRKALRERISACVSKRDAERAEGQIGGAITSILQKDKGMELIGNLTVKDQAGVGHIVSERQEVEAEAMEHFEK